MSDFQLRVLEVLREIQDLPPEQRWYSRPGVLAGDISREIGGPGVGRIIEVLRELQATGRVVLVGNTYWRAP